MLTFSERLLIHSLKAKNKCHDNFLYNRKGKEKEGSPFAIYQWIFSSVHVLRQVFYFTTHPQGFISSHTINWHSVLLLIRCFNIVTALWNKRIASSLFSCAGLLFLSFALVMHYNICDFMPSYLWRCFFSPFCRLNTHHLNPSDDNSMS